MVCYILFCYVLFCYIKSCYVVLYNVILYKYIYTHDISLHYIILYYIVCIERESVCAYVYIYTPTYTSFVRGSHVFHHQVQWFPVICPSNRF